MDLVFRFISFVCVYSKKKLEKNHNTKNASKKTVNGQWFFMTDWTVDATRTAWIIAKTKWKTCELKTLIFIWASVDQNDRRQSFGSFFFSKPRFAYLICYCNDFNENVQKSVQSLPPPPPLCTSTSYFKSDKIKVNGHHTTSCIYKLANGEKIINKYKS